eukprot:SAG11_NODE_251_length_11596_cov_5.592763_3_plen_356_part_00
MRRTTLLEQVLVSRSSADQRKGRAGRIAPGNCIRLYADEDLIRPSITPEILRSSLDKVVLQLVQLKFSPLTFNFITRPPEPLLRASISTLTELDCIEDCIEAGVASGGDRTIRITRRGRCFVDLDFDPRLSNFVAMAAERFGREQLAAEVAAILSAPGSIFFMAGAGMRAVFTSSLVHLIVVRLTLRGAARSAAMEKITRMAAHHESDLLLQCQVFEEWVAAGDRRARVMHAQKEGLNNKVLENVDSTVKTTLKAIRKEFTSAECDASDSDVAAIGQCLINSYPEQLGQMLMPLDPSAGVFLLANRQLRGTLSQSSVLAQGARHLAKADSNLFITMCAVLSVSLPFLRTTSAVFN